MSTEQRAIDGFRSQFGREPEIVVTSPGRVNLIGEHTDYNEGFVLPMAIDRATVIAAAARSDGRVEAVSEGYGSAGVDLNDLRRGDFGWFEYLKGVAWAMGGPSLPGWDGFLASDIPLGASLSSSAALEVGVARVFAALSGDVWDAVGAARLAQRAENEWVGMNSGIMDQLVCAAGRDGDALLIDCRDLSISPVPVPTDVRVVILDTSTRRRLTESRYNERRAECESAAAALGVEALRDVIMSDLLSSEIDGLLAGRARHVVSENERTLAAANAMAEGDAAGLGRLMVQSHESLRDDFEVSSLELDSIVEAALQVDGCLGARMTGGGFAGCAVALVEAPAVDYFAGRVAGSYKETTGLSPAIYVCLPSDGASLSTRIN